MVEAHGGYICRYQDVDASWLQQVARQALLEDEINDLDASLQVSVMIGAKVARFAFDAGHTYGRKGARWYLEHHALARKLSVHFRETVHAYVFDPDELEQVVSYGDGRRVGGELLRYEDAELPDDDEEGSFEKAQTKWPLGHLSRVLGVQREELIRIPRQTTVLIDLGRPTASQPLWQLFPEGVDELKPHESLAP